MSDFVNFSRPFIDALSETFETMVQTSIKAHSPAIKKTARANGDVSAMIGMNGTLESNGKTSPFKGLLVLSWPEEVYIKIASAMLMEEYTEYNEEISDTGSEIANIVMGNAKNGLTPLGFKIEMATPTTVRGKAHEIKYPPKTTVVAMTITCDHGEFTLELCYQQTT